MTFLDSVKKEELPVIEALLDTVVFPDGTCIMEQGSEGICDRVVIKV